MSSDLHPRRSRVIRGLLTGFVLLTCFKVWFGPVQMGEKAFGQIPDAGTQRKQVLDEARRTNQLLAQIEQILKSHTFKVRVTDDDKKSGKTIAPGRAGPVGRPDNR